MARPSLSQRFGGQMAGATMGPIAQINGVGDQDRVQLLLSMTSRSAGGQPACLNEPLSNPAGMRLSKVDSLRSE